MKVSNCCYATPTDDVEQVSVVKIVELGFCSKCNEHTVFEEDSRYSVTEDQKERYQTLLNSGIYDGEKLKTNKWWKEFTTYEQAEAALVHMENRVNKAFKREAK